MSRNLLIPDSAMFTIDEYLTEREMSNISMILVEGGACDFLRRKIKSLC
jgi:hypothetical protein